MEDSGLVYVVGSKMAGYIATNSFSYKMSYRSICDPSGRNQSHVGRVRFPLRAEMHGRAHITDSCFIAFITSKIC